MHTRDYAAAALAELKEELERLTRLSASSETLGVAYAHTADALRQLITDEYRPWLEDELAAIRAFWSLDDIEPVQTGIEVLTDVLATFVADPHPDAVDDAAGHVT